MRILILLMSMAIACPAVCEETATKTWTYSTGLKITSIAPMKETATKSNWKIEPKGADYIVTIKDYFFRQDNFEEPQLSLAREGRVTLTIRTKNKKLFATSDEYPLHLAVKISGKRLQKGETLYFYNGDYGEVMGHYAIK